MNFWWDTGNGYVGDAWIDQCREEPVPREPAITQVYRVIESYVFAEPEPAVVPDGIGLAGARTYVYVVPPDPFSTSVNSPVGAGVIDVEIRVVAVAGRRWVWAIVGVPDTEWDAPYRVDEVVGRRSG